MQNPHKPLCKIPIFGDFFIILKIQSTVVEFKSLWKSYVAV